MAFQEARTKLLESSSGKFRAIYDQLIEYYGDGRTSAGCRVYVDGANNPAVEVPTWFQEAMDIHIKAQLSLETKNTAVAEMPE